MTEYQVYKSNNTPARTHYGALMTDTKKQLKVILIEHYEFRTASCFSETYDARQSCKDVMQIVFGNSAELHKF